MIRYDWIKIGSTEDYQQLEEKIDGEFAPGVVANQLQKQITREAEFVLVEHGYVDKDYRSTFYNFYAKKGRRYRDDCVRLHFFDKSVDYDGERADLTCTVGRLEDHYFGYIVLRPTIVATLGRSILSPNIRVGAAGLTIQSCHQVHLLGYTLSVWGFPSMAQHTDIAVCAHVSCWAILRHYSERFSQHRELLLHDITSLATPFEPGGLVPSLGLDIYEAERIFKAGKCFPLIVGKQFDPEPEFYAQLLAYLESGFPLFVAMHGLRHAIVVTGYSWCENFADPQHDNTHAWSQVKTLLSVDDNLLPYGCVDLKATGQQETTTTIYTADDFDAFIVPLPEKIHYSAQAVEHLSKEAFYSAHKTILGLPEESDLVRRYFVTTISALRRYARKNPTQFGVKLIKSLMCLQTAQFIWVMEYASKRQWSAGHVMARAIIDATASPNDNMPILFAHNSRLAIDYDRSSAECRAEIMELDRSENTPLARIEQNLQPVVNARSFN